MVKRKFLILVRTMDSYSLLQATSLRFLITSITIFSVKTKERLSVCNYSKEFEKRAWLEKIRVRLDLRRSMRVTIVLFDLMHTQ